MHEDDKYVNMLEDICEKCLHYDGSYCDYYEQNLYKGVSCSHFEKPLNIERPYLILRIISSSNREIAYQLFQSMPDCLRIYLESHEDKEEFIVKSISANAYYDISRSVEDYKKKEEKFNTSIIVDIASDNENVIKKLQKELEDYISGARYILRDSYIMVIDERDISCH